MNVSAENDDESRFLDLNQTSKNSFHHGGPLGGAREKPESKKAPFVPTISKTGLGGESISAVINFGVSIWA